MSEVHLSDDLTERVEDRIPHSDFESVDEYVEFVLSEVLSRVEHDGDTPSTSTASEEDVQNRLQSLGYLEE